MDQMELQDRLTALDGEALRLEAIGNLYGAVVIWRQVLGLLPAGSEPYRQIEQRVGQLVGGFTADAAGNWDAGSRGRGSAGTVEYAREPRRPADDPLGVAVVKTVGSM